jgi:hypothetical protein
LGENIGNGDCKVILTHSRLLNLTFYG